MVRNDERNRTVPALSSRCMHLRDYLEVAPLPAPPLPVAAPELVPVPVVELELPLDVSGGVEPDGMPAPEELLGLLEEVPEPEVP
ncbi:MAG TPA: hypothetical protein VEC35_13685 [Noviherbaspirillum sp.]|nr:hypothetical protein [Noviherbaspirillum sp.]